MSHQTSHTRSLSGNRLLLWSLPIFAAVAVVGCSKRQTTLITNQKDGWSFAMPIEFVKRSVTLPVGISQYMGPDEDGNRVNIVIESFQGKDSAESVGKAIAEKPPKGLIVQENSAYELAAGKGYTVRGTVANGLETQRQVYLSDHGVCVMFTLTSGTKTFEKWDEVFHDSLMSFKWSK